jgi:hypothetical protein
MTSFVCLSILNDDPMELLYLAMTGVWLRGFCLGLTVVMGILFPWTMI